MSQQLKLCMMDILKTRAKIRNTHEELYRIERRLFGLYCKYAKEKDSSERKKIIESIADCFESFKALETILKDCNKNLNDYYGKFCRLYKEYIRE